MFPYQAQGDDLAIVKHQQVQVYPLSDKGVLNLSSNNLSTSSTE